MHDLFELKAIVAGATGQWDEIELIPDGTLDRYLEYAATLLKIGCRDIAAAIERLVGLIRTGREARETLRTAAGALPDLIARVERMEAETARLREALPDLYDVALALRQHFQLFCGPDDPVAVAIITLADKAIAKGRAALSPTTPEA